ncbi:MAG: hypothetical protein HYV90_00185 [Candidatus Woesebacteria bacterium]|nr:MAG: hypothetical protein HYV90_00185 [Candidatus Woesebacteria bacterium]
MDKLFSFLGARKDRETSIEISLTPGASDHLKRMILRPNPELAEFGFFGLGQNGTIDQILDLDEKDLSYKNGLTHSLGGFSSNVGGNEWNGLVQKLIQSGRRGDFLVFGHFHPSGTKRIAGATYHIDPGEALLVPSGGSLRDPTTGGDIGFFKALTELNPNLVPYMGIAANTKSGPKLRIYEIDKLIKIRRYNDIDHVPQTTIDL